MTFSLNELSLASGRGEVMHTWGYAQPDGRRVALVSLLAPRSEAVPKEGAEKLQDFLSTHPVPETGSAIGYLGSYDLVPDFIKGITTTE